MPQRRMRDYGDGHRHRVDAGARSGPSRRERVPSVPFTPGYPHEGCDPARRSLHLFTPGLFTLCVVRQAAQTPTPQQSVFYPDGFVDTAAPSPLLRRQRWPTHGIRAAAQEAQGAKSRESRWPYVGKRSTWPAQFACAQGRAAVRAKSSRPLLARGQWKNLELVHASDDALRRFPLPQKGGELY